jgi:hypothetical protein
MKCKSANMQAKKTGSHRPESNLFVNSAKDKSVALSPKLPIGQLLSEV